MLKDFQKEIIPIADEDLFVVLNHPNAKFDYPVHYHSEYEINLVMNTHGERVVGDSVRQFDELDLVMTGPNVLHAWRGEVVEGNHVITIQFTEGLNDFPIMKKRLFAPIKQLLSDAQHGLYFSKKSTEAIRDKIKECIDNRKVIISEYKKFRRSNTKHAKENVKSFLEA